ncbi:DUF6160 family protein [Marinobacter sp. NFXS9]|uniref:DUF6160 family protein n=1 Tax=Marinobacter sp. NFXS9 TaxID=2818433 RepID=UPI0032DF2551
MKSLKLTALALAVSGLPLAAQAELKALDDSAMGGITGQAGVTIELETQVNIGEVRYTDEGTLAVSDVFIGGANRDDMFSELGFAIPNEATDLIDNIKINIDVLEDGDAAIDVFPLYGSPIDFAVRTGAWELRGDTDSTVIMDNLSIEGLATEMKIRVDTATDKLNLKTRFAIDDMDVDVPFMAVGIRDLELTGAGYDDSPNIVTLGAIADIDVYKAPNGAGNDSLAVDLNTFDADMNIGGVLVGGTSIGSVAFDDLSIQNTQMRIYGH